MKRRKQGASKRPYWAADALPYEAILNEAVIGQPKATRIVAGVLASQVARLRLKTPPIAPRVLIVGETSSGKTFLANEAAKLLQVPTATVNLSMATPEGYKGMNLGTGVRTLISEAGVGGAERAQNSSILILDEVDKIARRSKADKWVDQLQYATLPILHGEPLIFNTSDFDEEPESFSTFNTLTFLMGVFPGLSKSTWSTPERARNGLVRYGFCEEWASRITHFIYLDKLKRKDVLNVLNREASNIAGLYQTGDEVPELSGRAINQLATKVTTSKYGLRSARSEIHNQLMAQAYKGAVDVLL